MCFGKSKSTPPPPVPAPVQPTRFEYVNADTSNSQQRQAAVVSSTQGQPASFGSELGGGGAVAPGGTAAGV